jgi:pre-mRNA-splicing factor SYF1
LLFLCSIKRSVQSKYNSDVNFLASQILSSRGLDVEGLPVGNGDENTKVSGFVRAQETEPQVTPAPVVNPDEISLDDSDEDEEVEIQTESKDVENKTIPAAVFGGLAANNNPTEALGAKERFKRKAA